MPNLFYIIDSLENKYQMARKICDWEEAHRLFVELEKVREFVPVTISSAEKN